MCSWRFSCCTPFSCPCALMIRRRRCILALECLPPMVRPSLRLSTPCFVLINIRFPGFGTWLWILNWVPLPSCLFCMILYGEMVDLRRIAGLEVASSKAELQRMNDSNRLRRQLLPTLLIERVCALGLSLRCRDLSSPGLLRSSVISLAS